MDRSSGFLQLPELRALRREVWRLTVRDSSPVLALAAANKSERARASQVQRGGCCAVEGNDREKQTQGKPHPSGEARGGVGDDGDL